MELKFTNDMKSYNRLKKKKNVIKSTKNYTSYIVYTLLIFLFVIMTLKSFVNWEDIKVTFNKDNNRSTIGQIIKYETIEMPTETNSGTKTTVKYKTEISFSVYRKSYKLIKLLDKNPSYIKTVLVTYNIENPDDASISIE